MKSKAIIIGLIIMINACKVEQPKLPRVITLPVSEVTWNYAISGGEIISEGSSPVTARGVVYSISKDIPPTIDGQYPYTYYTEDSSGIGSFTSKINLIYLGAGYTISHKNYLRAYASNSVGTAYGDTISVSPKSYPPHFYSINLISLVSTSATINCEIGLEENHPFAIDEFYFCYGLSPSPTVEGTHSVPQQVPNWGGYYKLLNILPNTTYYLRGYVKNESGFAYSPEISFTTFDGELTDLDGNIYPTKNIGNQVWMASNLIVSKYNDGTTIPTLYNDWDWSVTQNGAHSADRYNYYTVVDNRRLCPSGWHIPSDSEWKTLEIYLEMSPSDADMFGENRGSDEGGKLKMKSNNAYDKKVWEYPNLGATNSSGFSAQGIPWRYASGSYSTSYYSTSFWTNSALDETSVVIRRLYYNSAQIARYSDEKNAGLCVRCIKD